MQSPSHIKILKEVIFYYPTCAFCSMSGFFSLYKAAVHLKSHLDQSSHWAHRVGVHSCWDVHWQERALHLHRFTSKVCALRGRARKKERKREGRKEGRPKKTPESSQRDSQFRAASSCSARVSSSAAEGQTRGRHAPRSARASGLFAHISIDVLSHLCIRDFISNFIARDKTKEKKKRKEKAPERVVFLWTNVIAAWQGLGSVGTHSGAAERCVTGSGSQKPTRVEDAWSRSSPNGTVWDVFFFLSFYLFGIAHTVVVGGSSTLLDSL